MGLEDQEVRGAGSKAGGSVRAFSEKDAGRIIAFMDGAKPFTSKMVGLIIVRSSNRRFRTCARYGRVRFAQPLGDSLFVNKYHHEGSKTCFFGDIFCIAILATSSLFPCYPRQVVLRPKQLLSRSSNPGYIYVHFSHCFLCKIV